MLMDCLQLNSIIEVEQALQYLREKNFIEIGERVFLITAEGVDFLLGQLPDPPANPPANPPGPSPGPPKKDPDDPSLIPRRPLPTAGAGQIALPIPKLLEDN